MDDDEEDPTTVEAIFADFDARRGGFLRAFSTDFDVFYALCDPEKENLCLYTYSNATWEVKPPRLDIPTKLPEPVVGINFARDGMRRKDWVRLVASYSDGWLLAVAFHFAARLDRHERNRLFDMINELRSLSELMRLDPPPE